MTSDIQERLRRERSEYGYPFMPWHLRPTSSEICGAAIEQLRKDFAEVRAALSDGIVKG